MFTEKDKQLVKGKLSDFCRQCINNGICDGNEDVDCPTCPINNAYEMINETEFEED